MRALRASLALALFSLSACVGSGAPALDEPTLFAAKLEQGRRLATGSLELRGRLANLDLALTVAASEFCGKLTQPKLGAVFGTRSSFKGTAAQVVAAESLGLSTDPTVAHVSPGGPLATASIQAGDRILAVNGAPVASIDEIGAQLWSSPGRVELLVGRGAQKLARTVLPAPACPVSLEYALSPALVTWKVSKFVGGVPLGLLNLLDDDDELAVILGHQLAHLLFERASDDALAQERRADRLGLFVAARAGYDVSVAVQAWEKLISEYPWLIAPPTPRSSYNLYPHRSVAQRMEGIRATLSEIEQLRRSELPLVPPS